MVFNGGPEIASEGSETGSSTGHESEGQLPRWKIVTRNILAVCGVIALPAVPAAYFAGAALPNVQGSADVTCDDGSSLSFVATGPDASTAVCDSGVPPTVNSVNRGGNITFATGAFKLMHPFEDFIVDSERNGSKGVTFTAVDDNFDVSRPQIDQKSDGSVG